jgi:hypothetical protein
MNQPSKHSDEIIELFKRKLWLMFLPQLTVRASPTVLHGGLLSAVFAGPHWAIPNCVRVAQKASTVELRWMHVSVLKY